MHEETAISLLGRNESFLSSCGTCDGLLAAAARSLANGPAAYPAGRALASRHRARPRRRCSSRSLIAGCRHARTAAARASKQPPRQNSAKITRPRRRKGQDKKVVVIY